ncbi:uncharacterized protein LOC132916131 [Bombus pascuorum]|uniref:uncharacterized protein LOC132916131 n=1 Tax=Bombus pascuorum TaxID=65598 RepID=UPI00298E24F8|nr:uncharacterized protein LOC132916131 [Bombus pascuorum]
MEWGISAILSSTNINFGPGGVQHGTQKENLETDVDLYVGSGTSSEAPVQFFFRQGNSRLFYLRTRIYVCCLCMCVYARTHRRPHSSRHGFEGITIFLRCVRGASGAELLTKPEKEREIRGNGQTRPCVYHTSKIHVCRIMMYNVHTHDRHTIPLSKVSLVCSRIWRAADWDFRSRQVLWITHGTSLS